MAAEGRALMADILKLIASLEWVVLGIVFALRIRRWDKRIGDLYVDIMASEAWNRREGGDG